MTDKSMIGRLLTMSLLLGASVIAAAQTQPLEQTSFLQGGNQEYWLVVDEFADRAVRFAHAKHFIQLERPMIDRQCEQYSRVAVRWEDELAAVRRAGVSTQSKFWDDVRLYSISMIEAPGVPFPVH